MRHLVLRSLPVVWAALAACGYATDTGIACTQEFRIATVYVRDVTSAAVGGASVVAVVARTGDTLTSTSLALWAPGHYLIVDDGAVSKLKFSGDAIVVTVSSAKGNASAGYVFDVPNGCHINKVSGPDTLTVQ